ncbi:50S ribosomal protein P1 [uncultured Methanosphaera sp.]|jgi:large subunit ribosomal protein L12|uniref:50S ribosomal protein P1 n=1 Tax=Methanosphaera sp. TaxID=2666342 RepID=UPI0025CF6897|nr:50S ribosomal protein P1 [uncultured Methanosphaera sp.]
MEYVYAALLLNAAEKDINEENVTAVLSAAGVEVDDARVKALIASLEDVDIEEAIATAAVAAPAAAAAAPAEEEAEEEAPAEEEDDEEEAEAAAAAGLGALFG